MSMLLRHNWSQKFKEWLVQSGFAFKSQSFVRADGQGEFLFLGELNNSSRPVVLFLHGLGNDALFPNIEMFRHLLTSGYNIATADLDGHGKYNSNQFCELSITSLVEDVIQQIDKVIMGKPRIHLCGYSFGAVLLLNYAVHNPERVISLSLIGMPTSLKSNINFAMEILSPLSPSFRSALKDYGVTGITPAVGFFLRQRFPFRIKHAIQSPDMAKKSYLSIAGEIVDRINPLELLKLVTFPTLYIAGSMDFIANTKVVIEKIKDLNVQIFELKNETHFSSMLSPKTPLRIEVLLRSSL